MKKRCTRFLVSVLTSAMIMTSLSMNLLTTQASETGDTTNTVAPLSA